ncbi:unnamed protein product, partial [Medioppia subpectinata]
MCFTFLSQFNGESYKYFVIKNNLQFRDYLIDMFYAKLMPRYNIRVRVAVHHRNQPITDVKKYQFVQYPISPKIITECRMRFECFQIDYSLQLNRVYAIPNASYIMLFVPNYPDVLYIHSPKILFEDVAFAVIMVFDVIYCLPESSDTAKRYHIVEDYKRDAVSSMSDIEKRNGFQHWDDAHYAKREGGEVDRRDTDPRCI